MGCLIVGLLSVFLSLTNCNGVEAIERSTDVEKILVEASITTHSTELFFTPLLPTLSSISFSHFSSTSSVQHVSEPVTRTPLPKEYFGTLGLRFNSSSIPIQTSTHALEVGLHSTSILPTSLNLDDLDISYVVAEAESMPMPSSTHDTYSTFQSQVSIHPSNPVIIIPALYTDYLTMTKNELTGEDWRSTDIVNIRTTPSLPFIPVTHSTYDVGLLSQTNSANMRTTNVRTPSFSNSDRKSDIDMHISLSEMVVLTNSKFYISVSSLMTQSSHSFSHASSNLTVSNDQLTHSSHSSDSTQSVNATSLAPPSTNHADDSNKKDSIYPFTFTFTSSSTSSLIYVMPVIVCVILGIMLFTVFKRWHFYCKLKKYRIRSSHTTESVLSQTLRTASPKQATSTDNSANARTHKSGSLQPKRAANTPSRSMSEKDLRRYKPRLEYINRGFHYSPDCPIHGRRTSTKTTQAVIEV